MSEHLTGVAVEMSASKAAPSASKRETNQWPSTHPATPGEEDRPNGHSFWSTSVPKLPSSSWPRERQAHRNHTGHCRGGIPRWTNRRKGSLAHPSRSGPMGGPMEPKKSPGTQAQALRRRCAHRRGPRRGPKRPASFRRKSVSSNSSRFREVGEFRWVNVVDFGSWPKINGKNFFSKIFLLKLFQ